MFESGAKALSVYSREINSWKAFRSYVKLFVKSKFPFIVIDPVDKCFKACQKHVCADMGIKHPSDEAWGKGYDAVKDEFVTVIDKLMSSGKGVIFISHAAEKRIKTRTGDEYDLLTSTLPNGARDIMEGNVDVWAYYHYKKEKRYLTILGDDHIGAGHRIEKHFRYTNGIPIRKIWMGTSAKMGAENLIKAFENKMDPPQKTKEVKLKKK